MRTAMIFLLFFVVSCASVRIYKKTTPRVNLFPHGTYKHWVRVHLDRSRQYSFTGIVSLAKEKTTVVGLSPFDTTLFRITDTKKGTRVEIYSHGLKKYNNKLVQFYSVMKRVLSERYRKGKLKPLEVKDGAEVVRVGFRDLDENDIPERMDLKYSGYEIEVKVIGYEIS